ncbi:MAG TPA: hypothetical protein VF665_25330 [Longimicrobium sp.]|jgi:hypothetical protein|uniref:hypothetical protein n=1 Tax=Longimicrobium sp. TaxID=2029185 RepID=UPI002EDB8427
MTHNGLLRLASLLSVLFFTLHLADDIVRGMEPGTLPNLLAVPICVLWLYGTLVVPERRAGHVIMLLGALLGRNSKAKWRSENPTSNHVVLSYRMTGR